VSEQFKREPRYVVLKIKDILAYLTPAQIRQLDKIGETITANRAFHGKPPFNAVVVEQDWPEFDPTWAAIEARMTANAKVSGVPPQD
jgi:hypothetical protein